MSYPKPTARRGRPPRSDRPSARVPVVQGVFGPSTNPPAPEPEQPAPDADALDDVASKTAAPISAPVPAEPRMPELPGRVVTRSEPESGTHPMPEPEGAVLITGICGRLGKLLARELHRTDQVVGVDRRPFTDRPKDVTHHQVDIRRKKMKDIFRSRDIRAVVHLGVIHDPRRSERDRHSWNIVAFQKLLDYMATYEVPKLVVLSGANVYGPQANNPQFLTEDAPLLGAQHFGGMRDLVELDMLAQSFFWKHPNTETVVLRPCHIVGRVHNAASNYLRLERPVMVMGFDPMMQVVHEKDVVRAIQLSLKPGVRGIFNIRGPGEMPLSHLVRQAGGRPRLVPAPLARVALDQLWKLRLSTFPSQELDHLRYVCMVDDTRARTEMGYEPVYSVDRVLKDVRRLRYRVS